MDFLTNDTLYSIFGALMLLSTISILIWHKERTSEVLTIAIFCFGYLSMEWVGFRLVALEDEYISTIRNVWFLCWSVMGGLTILTCCFAHGLTRTRFSRYFKKIATIYFCLMVINFIAHLCRFYFGAPPIYLTLYSYATLIVNYFLFSLIITKTLQTHWQLRYSMIYKVRALLGKEELQ